MTTANPTYPVHVRGDLSIPPGRWVWLFKWLLLVPHYFLLFFVCIGAFFVTVYAFFAILFTGKFPKGAFDYDLGTMRWMWRVSFYAYNALGTDKYPPFGFDPDPNYPADLDIEYPAQLSNWKVLVKWFLAIPHWLIVCVFSGGRGWWGLIGIITLINSVILLFTGKMNRELFDFVIGMNRWSNRVYAYVFMRDEYPPFHLQD